jgi:hypothetical protein
MADLKLNLKSSAGIADLKLNLKSKIWHWVYQEKVRGER